MSREIACSKREEALEAFSHIGKVISCTPYGNGHINDTFLVVADSGKRYIFQRINTDIFRNFKGVMGNIVAVTEHIRKRVETEGGDAARSTITVVHTNWGKRYFKDSLESRWRMYEFVEHTLAKDRVDTVQEFADCAEAFGRFQGWLSDFDASVLIEPIENFHNTPVRYENLMRAVREDPCGRVASVQKEIAFAMERKAFASTLENAHEKGLLPLRVTHNDTKLNNILFDTVSGEPICVVDLDTIMPGYSVNDFGDSIRFGATTALEDEADLSKVNFDISLYELYVKGFIEGAKGGLSEGELEMLPVGAMMMTFECGMRFLTDYLSGDTYFKISRPEHNLDRARNQFKLVSDMEAQLDKMHEIVNKYSQI